MFMKYRVNLKKTDEGHAVWVPGLPSCWPQGKTEEEALENIKDAIEAYLETVEELRRPASSTLRASIPQSSGSRYELFNT